MREKLHIGIGVKRVSEAFEVLNIYSTSLNFIEKFEDMEKEIYFLPKFDTIPKYPMGINRYDERLDVKRIKI